MTFFRHIRSLRDNESGASAVEFALIAPVMSLMLLGLLDYAVAVFHKMELASAVRSGSQYALVDTTDVTTITNVVNSSTNLDTNNMTITVTEFCECSDASTISCSGSSCASGPVRRFTTVTADYVHTWIFLPGTKTLSESSTLRTQ
ncbi:TadE/TadG family type IV pilus assembly protein [Pseudomonadota bacterium]